MNTQRNLTVIPVLKETGPSPVEVGYHHELRKSHVIIPQEQKQSPKRRNTSCAMKCENKRASQVKKTSSGFSCSPGQIPLRASLPIGSQGSRPHGSSPCSSWETRTGVVNGNAAQGETGKGKGNQEPGSSCSPPLYLYLLSQVVRDEVSQGET